MAGVFSRLTGAKARIYRFSAAQMYRAPYAARRIRNMGYAPCDGPR